MSKEEEMTFSDFWILYPRHIAKKEAEKAWNKLTPDQQECAFRAIPLHKKCWCSECREAHTIPHAATWLRGERFEDELPTEENFAPNWWTSDAATMDYGRSKGIPARPGEDMQMYRSRLRAA